MRYPLIAIIVIGLFIGGCKTVTPVTTSFQNARVYPGLFEVNAFGYATQFANGHGTGIESYSAGFQISEGFDAKPFFLPGHVYLAPRFKGQLTVSRFEPTTHMVGYVSEEIKFSIVRDRIAIAPLSGGFHVSDQFIHYQFEPVGLFGTIPLTEMFEINCALKIMGLTYNPTPESDDLATFIAINAGVGIGPSAFEVAIRPELSYIYNLNGDDHRIVFGVGTSLYTEPKRQKKIGSRKKRFGR